MDCMCVAGGVAREQRWLSVTNQARDVHMLAREWGASVGCWWWMFGAPVVLRSNNASTTLVNKPLGASPNVCLPILLDPTFGE